MRQTAPVKKPARTTSTHDVEPAARAFDMDSLVQGGSDIHVLEGGKDFQKLVDAEGFMHEELEIRFHETTDPSAPQIIELGAGISGVSGKGGRDYRRGFLRGKVYKMPRFMVEIFAHAKVTTLKQKPGPSGRPDDIINEEKHSFFYPFEVIRDPNPQGRAWLEKVLKDPA